MSMVGERGLSLMNAGQNPFGNQQQNITITPGVVNIQIDAKTIARARRPVHVVEGSPRTEFARRRGALNTGS